jgi:hypothetical protein
VGRGVESDVFDRTPNLDGGTGPLQLLGDVEAALAELKGSAVFDREPQTVEAVDRLVEARIAQRRAVELDEGRTVIEYASDMVCFM